MRNTTPHGWAVLEAERPVLSLEYSFGPGRANTLVVRAGGGKLLAVSPALTSEPGVHEDLAAYGSVAVLIAPNRFHHLGVEGWLKRWPQAQAYAGEQSLERLNRTCSAGAVFKPLVQLRPLPQGVHIDNPPGMKNTDLVLRIATREGWLWYFNDLLMNMRELPRNPVQRIALGLAGMKQGLCAPRMARFLNVSEKDAVRRWLLAELDAKPPVLAAFGHGDPLSGPDLAARLKSTIQAGFG